ncbi:TetR/AcrR family transcriptional regulator [Aeromicrobium phragmitis]|uniref:TetR/AcrR family transcriptional regulator n=1 Tax=Aeromicrobium phragmitis TaxID=2478914 RepID=A0A3L8PL94_9ACTN|nr:TetR/AcrR family transcriptional regulator [Aeromicrobium phragmitis]RLV55984.1 TetR/AcrR family transcriptional regulator [Aeromicrobium phragmitis]
MPQPTHPRPRRRDAIRNRERILDHAEKVFETDGLEVSFHRIAEDLGIGVGTVYRHFPDRDALILGLYERYQQRIDELGDDVLAQAPGMPRVERFIDATVAFSLRRPVARRIAAHVARAHPEYVETSPWAEHVAVAVRDAQRDGALRADTTVTDIAILAGMLADLTTIDEPRRSIIVPRMRAYILDALRPADDPRPPLPTNSPDIDDIATIAHQDGRA